jgi:hypothetical protein
MSDNLPALPKAKEITKKEAERLRASAFDLERRIKGAAKQVHESSWQLAAYLYEFAEAGGWALVGYDTLDEFLGQPDIAIKRSTFFSLTKVWRDLVVVKKLPVSDLKELEPTKVREVTPAIMRGEVTAEDALDDAEALSWRDLKKKYRPEQRGKHGQAPDDSTPLNAEDETVLQQCDRCGSWVDADVLASE